MYDFHTDKKRYFQIQLENAEEYVIPFIEKTFVIKKAHGYSKLVVAKGVFYRHSLKKIA